MKESVACDAYMEILIDGSEEVRPWEKPRPENEASLSKWIK